METEATSPCSPKPATGSYPEPTEAQKYVYCILFPRTQVTTFTKANNKKFKGVNLDDVGGHGIGPSQGISLSG
jgi:hypothetical protein